MKRGKGERTKKMKMRTFRGRKTALALGIAIICTAAWEAVQSTPVMLPLEQKTVILDAGHGGWDPGKTAENSADEKELNLAIVQELKSYLEQGGAEVVLTREEDTALGESKNSDMAKRKEIMDGIEADILVSIHQNAYTSAAAKGAQVFYYQDSAQGKALANCIQEALRSSLDSENTRQIKANDSYYVLRKSSVPAALVECGFLSNPTEAELLNTEEYQKKCAWAIYCGIAAYLEEDMV